MAFRDAIAYASIVGGLLEPRTHRVHPLTTETLVGRSRRADLCIREDFVSSVHASLLWQGSGWGLKDLGSRNGTAVNGKVVPPGTRRHLKRGDEITFGQALATWTLDSDAPPRPLARAEGRPVVVGSPGLLALPDDDEPALTVFATSVGRWQLEHGGQSREIGDHEHIELGGVWWVLRLPSVPAVTRGSQGARALSLEQSQLVLCSGRGKNSSLVSVRADPEAFSFTVGAGASVLRVLAESRDRSGEGWLEQSDLLERLSMTDNHLNVAVFRIRRQFADAGFTDATHIVERRNGRLRLGTTQLRVETRATEGP